ncbi:hypothetical protein D6810_02365 [Candidatus Dojkabacteria bacterium]|uniref:Uncharacterized protein n=1 Tax=Candidatus Dojkabacteria bacterium TaxID=2099670 RepID=A0A3M0YY17_9BACT|nr:MAG: hypothetical protein D6810_02365 [Candidatus Dojkabacteria bacterium]
MISDINRLKQVNPESAEFFKDGQNGDILIILADQEVAFLLRPTTGKIINTSKVSIESVVK